LSPFEYLSVLISVIVGLGLSHLLTSAARLIQRRRRVEMYLPTLLWMATLFVVQVQIWWVAYQSNGKREWTFFSFLFFLLIPVIGYVLCFLAVPDLDGKEVDLRANYHENRAWFFGLTAAAFTVTFVQDLHGSGGIPLDLNAAFRALFLVLALAAIVVRREWYHVLNATLALALFCAYVFAEFLRLA
jgi:hypothetical protein